MEAHSFGYWLRLNRKALDLTRQGLADRVGCSAGTIQKLEEEERRPSAQIVARLAEIFEISTDEQADFLRFARGELRFARAESKEAFSWRGFNQPTRSNLPAPVTSLIGREKEITDVCEYLRNEDIRVVTLIGPSGIGKTRLSIDAARTVLPDFPDGVFFIALAPLNSPNLITASISQTLGYVEAKNLDAKQQLSEGIGEKRILLVLDNCEHLIEEVAPLASFLLSTCSGLRILTTSRESLRVPGEWLYSVPTLNMPKENTIVGLENISEFPALMLFSDRARAARADFQMNANTIQTITSICAQLDGLPLAIELIAARIRFMSPQVLLERLNDEFILSADGMRAVSARQKTLNNVIGWSYHLLPAEEQRLFAFLSIFSGGFTLNAVEKMFSQTVTEKSATDILTSLLVKSLLQQAEDEPDGSRFSMLVTIQRFALTQLRSTELETYARQAHLSYFIELAELGDEKVRGPAVVEWIRLIESEHNNFRAALEWSVTNRDAESALRLLVALGWFWQLAGHFSEARNWLDKIRELPNVNEYPALYARLLNHIGRVSWTQDRTAEARTLLQESQSICQRLGDEGEPILAEALNWLGLLALTNERNSDKARSLIQQALEIHQSVEDQKGVALSMFNLGIVEMQSNRDDVALSLLETSLSLSQESSDLIITARISRYLGNLLLKQGNYEKARLFFEEHLRIDAQLQFWDGIGHAYGELGNLFRYQGEYDQAEQFYQKGLDVHYEHGLEPDIQYHQCLFMTALHLNNYSLASQRIEDFYNSASKIDGKVSACGLFIGFAAVAAGTDQFERAARLRGAAQAILETINFQYDEVDRAEFERHIQIAREQLGEDKFELLFAAGRAMTMEQAIAYALNE